MKKYCEKFDVYFDDVTGEYLESSCTDPGCEYCKNKPAKLLDFCKTCYRELPSKQLCQGVIRSHYGDHIDGVAEINQKRNALLEEKGYKEE